jgi:hypothetical protein
VFSDGTKGFVDVDVLERELLLEEHDPDLAGVRTRQRKIRIMVDRTLTRCVPSLDALPSP